MIVKAQSHQEEAASLVLRSVREAVWVTPTTHVLSVGEMSQYQTSVTFLSEINDCKSFKVSVEVWMEFFKTKTTINIDDLQSANFELSVKPNQTWPVLHCFDESLKELCLRSSAHFR